MPRARCSKTQLTNLYCSGGNDNLVNIWNENGTKAHTFTEHQGAVKALAWCPWQPNLLASGGSTHFIVTKQIVI